MDDFKDIGRDLWKNKPLLITLVIGIAAVAYILIKNSQTGAATAPATTMASGSTLPTGSGGTYVENSYTTYAPVTNTSVIPAPVTAVAAIIYKTIKSGSLETTPHDTAGGKNILTVPKGATVTYVSGPVPDPLGGKKTYSVVNYNGSTGYIGSDVIGA